MVAKKAVASMNNSSAPQIAINEYGKYSNETIDTFVLEDDCMTSLQLAHLKGVRHSDMLRDIRKMEGTWVKLGLRNFALSTYIDSQNKVQPMYKLDKKQTAYVVSKFDDELRLKIINRWEDLETGKAIPIRYSDDKAIQLYQSMIEDRMRILDIEKEQTKHAVELFEHNARLMSVEKKLSELETIKARYDNGEMSEFEFYTSSAKQIVRDIVSVTNMSYEVVYCGIMDIYTTMPHYCRKNGKKSIFQTMAERKDKEELAKNYYKATKMFKEKVS